jgi:hypothetical protein
MKNVYFILLVLISLVSFHCQKEFSYVNLGGNENGFLTAITLQGNVVDENGQAANGVAIKVGEKSATTDARGYFRVVNASVIEKNVLVTAEKPGYFKAYRSFIATDGVNQVMIKLTRKDLSGQINSSTGGDVTLSNGSKVSLPANGIVTLSGGTYSGMVNVYAAYIDPTSKDISQTVPGSLMGDNKDGKKVSLISYGMLAVQLESSAGEKLQIAQGNVATLTFFIPPSIQSSAPASISLWYIDEQTGIWKEEGTATNSGNNYIGRVSHFSYWNCDIGGPSISLSVTLQSPTGSLLAYTQIQIQLKDTGSSYCHGVTDSLGQVTGLVPANKSLLMEVFAYPCYDAVYSTTIGPFNSNTDLGLVTVTSSSISKISGKLLDCSGSPAANGYAIINFNNIVRYARGDNTGNFASDILVCPGGSSSCQIIGVDNAAKQQGNVVNVNITGPETNVGNVSACGTSTEQYINYTFDAKDYSLTSNVSDSMFGNTYDSAGSFKTIIMATHNTDYIYFEFSHDNSAGTFPLIRLGVQNLRESSIVILQPSTITLTKNPQNPGEFYEGTLAAKFTDQQVSGSAIHNVSGSFRIRRQQ